MSSIALKPPPETLTVDTETLSCDGTTKDGGHPRVYLTMKNRQVDCPYCGRHFVLSANASAPNGH